MPVCFTSRTLLEFLLSLHCSINVGLNLVLLAITCTPKLYKCCWWSIDHSHLHFIRQVQGASTFSLYCFGTCFKWGVIEEDNKVIFCSTVITCNLFRFNILIVHVTYFVKCITISFWLIFFLVSLNFSGLVSKKKDEQPLKR